MSGMRFAWGALIVAGLFVGAVQPSEAATQVRATLSAGSVEAGAGVTLVVSVSDPAGGTGEPQFGLPAGLTLLGSEQGQSFSWVNGRSSNVIEYRYALGTDQPGRFAVGPIRVRVGKTVYECPAMALVVSAAASRPASVPRGMHGATFVVDVNPKQPYVGQLTQLTMRLVQTVSLTQSGANGTPTTTGFWSEGYGAPIEYRSSLGGRPAYVTERRVRIYPLAPGLSTIGSASLLVAQPSSGQDPFSGGVVMRPVELRSDSVRVHVRALPPGAPASFSNAVGTLAWSWSLDRGHTTQDQALTLRLDVRGTGNLPLLRTPALSLPDFEVFTGTVNDSFAPPGEIAPGRRRFQWTLMPRRTGTLRLPAPSAAWFDPATGAYRTAALPVLEVVVMPSGPRSDTEDDPGTLPAAIAGEASSPGGRAAQPWVLAIGGLLLGIAVRLWRRASAPDPRAGEREQQTELRQRLVGARGAEFWLVADEAVGWADRHGQQVLRLREDIAAARYGGQAAPEEDVRRRVIERLDAVAPAAVSAAPLRSLAVALAAVALASWFVGSGVRGPEALAARVRAGDARARERDVAGAAGAWAPAWREAPGDASLAARLAWAELRRSHLPEAAAWVLRGRSSEPRSRALGWAESQVREAGGMVGAPGNGLPVRAIEWAALAFALALGAALEWPRRWSTALLLALAAAAALVMPLRDRRARTVELAVVRSETTLAGADVGLAPGEVVRVLGRDGGGVRISAGRDLAGHVPEAVLLRVHERVR